LRAARRAALFGAQDAPQGGGGGGGGGGGWGAPPQGDGRGGGGGGGGGRGYAPAGRPPGETDATRGLDNGQLVTQQRTVMQRAHTHNTLLLHAYRFISPLTRFLCAEQDAALSSICATVGALKRTSYAIGEELTLQEGLLESFEADVDKTSGTMRRVEQRAAQLAGARSLTARGEDGAPPAPPTWAEEAQASCSVM
jgi:hypothetical protein